ncbi:hypothetical protein CDAR_497411 [Caerostris darwini]|uniref:Uncharacterized protein n=1 Tax=Caerostris darwini TaxID=1538125 RepID=A0AAV4S4D7_9ARAC|nr:hypothetical protein CDAR_497411 [Caerostris darwini]
MKTSISRPCVVHLISLVASPVTLLGEDAPPFDVIAPLSTLWEVARCMGNGDTHPEKHLGLDKNIPPKRMDCVNLFSIAQRDLAGLNIFEVWISNYNLRFWG